jgi:hypothetical protein
MDPALSLFGASSHCRCYVCCLSHAPKTVEVKDAGSSEVNGVYTKMDRLLQQRAVSYTKQGGNQNGTPTDFYIVLCYMSKGSYKWFICCTAKGVNPGTDDDVDFYAVPYSEHFSFFPPGDGWELTAGGVGIRPMPRLVYDEHFYLERESRPRVGGEPVVNCLEDPGPKLASCLSDRLEQKAFDPLIREAAWYCSYVQTMLLWSYQEQIYAALFQFIFAAHRANARKNVVQLIETCSQKERCVLLELAVWKFLCTMQCPNNLTDALAWSDWSRTGWKIRKPEMRRSNAVHIIMTSVLPFMDPSSGL